LAECIDDGLLRNLMLAKKCFYVLNERIQTPECFVDDISKNNNFNFLRLLLAYIVVVFHSMGLSKNKYPLAKLFDGHIAVCGFFIISGFLIIRSCWSSNSLKEYFIKRCKREPILKIV